MNRPFSREPVPLEAVSYHAVIRYVQRVCCIELPETGKNIVDAEAHARAAGMSIDIVRALILTPQVQSAIRLGLPAMRTKTFIARIGTEGVVTTILSRASSKTGTKRMKAKGRRETRRAIQAHNRKKTKTGLTNRSAAPCQ